LSHFPKVVVVVLNLEACAAVSAQIPAGWNYNPFLYYPFTAQPAPVQETAKVAAARAAHLAAHSPTLPPEDPAGWSPYNLFLLFGDNQQVPFWTLPK
jgi:hypothetical protein